MHVFQMLLLRHFESCSTQCVLINTFCVYLKPGFAVFICASKYVAYRSRHTFIELNVKLCCYLNT